MNAKPYLFSAALLASGFTTAFAADGQRVEKNQLPSAVQRVIDSSGSNAGPVKQITKQTVDGKIVYDVQFEKDNAINPRLRISEDGTVVSGNRSTVAQDAHRAADRATTGVANAANRTAAATATAAERTAQAADRQLATGSRGMGRVDTESMMELDALPSAVRAAIQKEAAGREIVDIDEETHEGRKVYEVEFAQSGRNAQIHVSEDGKVLKTDNMSRDKNKSLFAGTQLSDTPAAVQATIKREVGDRRIADIDKERRTGRVVYEVEVDDNDRKWQLHIAEDGSIVKDDRVAE